MKPHNHHTLPEGWEMKRLGEICKSITVGIASAATHAYRNKGVTLFRNQNIKEGILDDSDILFLDEDFEKLYKNKRLRPGDILTVRTGYPGVSCVVPERYKGAQSFTTLITRPLQSLVNSEFLCYHINSDFGKSFFDSSQIGGGQKNVGAKTLYKYQLLLPPLPEQRQIAAVLGTWDRAIEQTTELLKVLRTRHRGLMHQLLTGKKRLPGFAGEWKHTELSEVFERVNRRNAEGNTNVLTISAQQGLIGQGRYFNKNIASEDVANYFLLHRGEFAYNKSYSAGYPMGAIKRLDQYDKGILSPLYICFRLRDAVENEASFFTHFFEGGCLSQAIGEIAQEGARNHGLLNIGVGDFFGLRLIIPQTIEEQRAIACALDTSLKEIQQNKAKLEALREQKRGLMQCLLTGQVRIPIPTEAA